MKNIIINLLVTKVTDWVITMKKINLTAEGKEKIEKELLELKTVKRQETADKIKLARSYGDLSENSEYDEAKNEQAMIEARIATLEQTLKNAVIIADKSERESKDEIHVGSKVKVLDCEYKDECVSSFEADPLSNKISEDSPLGKELLGKKAGKTISVNAPIGILKYKILEVIQ